MTGRRSGRRHHQRGCRRSQGGHRRRSGRDLNQFGDVLDEAPAVSVFGLVTAALIGTSRNPRDSAVFTMADIAQFEAALINLAINSRDAMDGEGHIVIAVGKVGIVGALDPAQALSAGARNT